jgi:hypothetical protein
MPIDNLQTPRLVEPATDHPLFPLFRAYNVVRDESVRYEHMYEAIAPTPMTLASSFPLDTITGQDRERYIGAYRASEAFANAAYHQYNALMSVLDSLGGM